jgi:DNA-binding PucR family transcriptional regulator
MANRCSVSVTAKALHVHPNTVAYRLRRVEELLDVDLGDPQAMLHLQLALMIEEILGDEDGPHPRPTVRTDDDR